MSKSNKIAIISDIHGCIIEFKELYENLSWCSLDEIWTVGDLVDRGPDSGACIQFCIDNGIKSVMGNHEQSILNHFNRFQSQNLYPKNVDKKITLCQLNNTHMDYIKALPKLHVVDSNDLIIVHAGLWPKLPLHLQPDNVIRAQMIHPDILGVTRWWGTDATSHTSGKTEEQNREEGFERWYKLYDDRYDVVYGHSVFAQPNIQQNPCCGKTIGIDTGSCFGGSLTALIHDNGKEPVFLSVKSKKIWYNHTTRSLWEK